MLGIFIDEADYWEGELLHEAIVKKVRSMGIAGATVSRGLAGYGGRTHLHRSGWLGEPAEHPIIVTIIDTAERIEKVLPLIEEMLGECLVVLSDVEMIQYASSGSKH
jgi:PII-like signaling protein